MPFLMCAQNIEINGATNDSLNNSIPFVSIIASIKESYCFIEIAKE